MDRKEIEELFEVRMRRLKIENEQNWREDIDTIPWLQFPSDWKVRIIPPFADAVVRFQVTLPSGKHKSIYLDSREALGYYGGPYWEVYPVQGDVGRCDREDAEELMKMIADEREEGEES